MQMFCKTQPFEIDRLQGIENAFCIAGHKLSERVAGILGTIGLSVAAVLAYVVAFNYFTMPRNAEGVFDTLQPINISFYQGYALQHSVYDGKY